MEQKCKRIKVNLIYSSTVCIMIVMPEQFSFYQESYSMESQVAKDNQILVDLIDQIKQDQKQGRTKIMKQSKQISKSSKSIKSNDSQNSSNFIQSGICKNKRKSIKWTAHELDQFYAGLNKFGTEFSMIQFWMEQQNCVKTYEQIKNKYLKEVKVNYEKIYQLTY